MISRPSNALLVAVASLTALASSLPAASPHWPNWRGPSTNGAATPGTYPVKLNDDTLRWQIELPGKGCSTPIVWDGTIILTTPLGDHDGVMAFDWNGKELWRTKLDPRRDGKHRNGSSSNPSAITDDGKSLFTYFKSGTLAALDFSGKTLWKTNLQKRFGKDTLYWDLGTSPVLTKQNVIVAVMHSGGSYLAAFDRSTGDLAWKTDREYKTPVEGDHSYATPHVITRDGRELIVTWGAERVTTHDAADGTLLAACGGFNPNKKKNWVAVASSVIVGDTVVVPYGRGKHLAAVQLGGTGDVTDTHRLWTRGDDSGAFVPTPAAHDDHLLVLGDRGQIHCINPADGKTVWSNKLPRAAQNYYASPTVADGNIYAVREDGQLYVTAATPDLPILFERQFGVRIIATPVATGNRILLRSDTHLMSFGTK